MAKQGLDGGAMRDGFIPHAAYILTGSRYLDQFRAVKVLRAFDMQRMGHLHDPWEIEFHLTGKCPLKCVGCSYATRRTGESLSVEDIRNVMSRLKGKRVKSVFFSGGGDPFTWPHWQELIRLKENIFGEVPVGVASNMIYFKKRKIDPQAISFYQVHIVGFDRNSCLAETGVDCFNLMKQNLEHLFSNKSADMTIALKFLIHRGNIGVIRAFLDFIGQYAADTVVMKLRQDFVGDDAPRTAMTDLVHAAVSEIAGHQTVAKYDIAIDNLRDAIFEDWKAPRTCYVAQSGLYCLIRENGDVFPCIAGTYDSSNALGNIRRNDIVDILTGTDKRRTNAQNMIDMKCPVRACRHYRFNQIIERYTASPERSSPPNVQPPVLL